MQGQHGQKFIVNNRQEADDQVTQDLSQLMVTTTGHSIILFLW